MPPGTEAERQVLSEGDWVRRGSGTFDLRFRAAGRVEAKESGKSPRHRSACRVTEGSTYLLSPAGAAARPGRAWRRGEQRREASGPARQRASIPCPGTARPARLRSPTAAPPGPAPTGWEALGGRGPAQAAEACPCALGSASFPACARGPSGDRKPPGRGRGPAPPRPQRTHTLSPQAGPGFKGEPAVS